LASYRARGGYDHLIALHENRRTTDQVIEALSQSGLQGLGGAGFPAGRKWTTVRAQPAPRLMTINADEGEPGTFKDRFWLEADPHLMLEGALVAAHCVGVERIYLSAMNIPPCVKFCRARSQRLKMRALCRKALSKCGAAQAPMSAAKKAQ
jgi:formate dehydrogenase